MTTGYAPRGLKRHLRLWRGAGGMVESRKKVIQGEMAFFSRDVLSGEWVPSLNKQLNYNGKLYCVNLKR